MKAELTTPTLDSISTLAQALGDLANRGFALGDIALRTDGDGISLGRLVAHTERGDYVDYVSYRLVLNLEEQDMSPKDLMVLSKDVATNN